MGLLRLFDKTTNFALFALTVCGWLFIFVAIAWFPFRFSAMQKVGAAIATTGVFVEWWTTGLWNLIGLALILIGLWLFIRPPDDWWKRKRQALQTRLKAFKPLAHGVSAKRPTFG